MRLIDRLKGTKKKLLNERELVVSSLESFRMEYNKSIKALGVAKDFIDEHTAKKNIWSSQSKIGLYESRLQSIDTQLSAMQ